MTGCGLRIGSLCSGYGGLDLAVSAVMAARPVWFADNDPHATTVLAHRWPGVPNHGDITTVAWADLAPVDVITAGFPCQDISNAGRRAGIEGSRSGVWTHVATAVRVLRPRLVLLENVSALLVRGLDRVVADLAQIGYVGSWTCLRASDIGAPHRRERMFIAAWPADTPRPRLQRHRLPRWTPGSGPVDADTDRVGWERDGSARQSAQRHPQSTDSVAADPAGIGEREPADQAVTFTGERDSRPEPRSRSVRPAPDSAGDPRWLSDRDHRVVADPASVRHGHAGPAGIGGLAPAAVASPATDPEGHRRDEGRTEPAGQQRRPVVAIHSHTDWGTYGPAVYRWEHLTGRAAPDPTEPGRHGQPQLSPRFVEWVMGLPAGWVTDVPGLTRNARLKLLGNGVVPAQGAAALTNLLTAPAAAGTEAAA